MKIYKDQRPKYYGLGALALAFTLSACGDSGEKAADLFESEYDKLFSGSVAATRYSVDGDTPIDIYGFWMMEDSQASDNGGIVDVRVKISSDNIVFAARCSRAGKTSRGSAQSKVTIDTAKRTIDFASESTVTLKDCGVNFKATKGVSTYTLTGRRLSIAGEKFLKMGELSDDPKPAKKNATPAKEPAPAAAAPSAQKSSAPSPSSQGPLQGLYFRSEAGCEQTDEAIRAALNTSIGFIQVRGSVGRFLPEQKIGGYSVYAEELSVVSNNNGRISWQYTTNNNGEGGPDSTIEQASYILSSANTILRLTDLDPDEDDNSNASPTCLAFVLAP